MNKYIVLEQLLQSICEETSTRVVKEYTFDEELYIGENRKRRAWRFDYALLNPKIAIEVEGGIYTKGRHIQPTGYLNDIQKYNRATALGWKVFRISANGARGEGTRVGSELSLLIEMIQILIGYKPLFGEAHKKPSLFQGSDTIW